jgi:error-prone DNA polymerase
MSNAAAGAEPLSTASLARRMVEEGLDNRGPSAPWLAASHGYRTG